MFGLLLQQVKEKVQGVESRKVATLRKEEE